MDSIYITFYPVLIGQGLLAVSMISSSGNPVKELTLKKQKVGVYIVTYLPERRAIIYWISAGGQWRAREPLCARRLIDPVFLQRWGAREWRRLLHFKKSRHLHISSEIISLMVTRMTCTTVRVVYNEIKMCLWLRFMFSLSHAGLRQLCGRVAWIDQFCDRVTWITQLCDRVAWIIQFCDRFTLIIQLCDRVAWII